MSREQAPKYVLLPAKASTAADLAGTVTRSPSDACDEETANGDASGPHGAPDARVNAIARAHPLARARIASSSTAVTGPGVMTAVSATSITGTRSITQ